MDTYEFLLEHFPKPFAVCGRGKRSHLQNKINPMLRMIGSFPCRCWTCWACAAKLRFQFGMWYGFKLVECETLFLTKAAKWKTQNQKLRRLGSSWLKVMGSIISTTEIETSVRFYDPIPNFGKMIMAIERPCCKKFYPVEGSADWKPPPRNIGEWSTVGPAGELDAVVDVIKEFDLDSVPKIYSPKHWVVKAMIPEEWEEERIEQFENALK